MKKTPRPHQKSCINAAYNHFKRNDRGRAIMACGTGKSLSALWIAKRLKAKSIVIFVPNLILERQQLETWKNELKTLGFPHKFMAIGSDKRIKKEFDTPSSTSEADIVDFLEKWKDWRYVVLCTYQSADKLSGALGEVGNTFDFGIVDEAHVTAGINKQWSIVLDDEFIPIKKRVFMTATEKVVKYTSDKVQVTSMDDVEVYGKRFFEYPLIQGINDKVISDYRILTYYSDSEKISDWLSDNLTLKLTANKKYEIKMVAAAVLIAKSMKEYGVKKVITYHWNIKRAKKMVDVLNYVLNKSGFKVPLFHINHESKNKSDILSDFEECETGILTNSKAMQVGIDIPSVDAICAVDEKQSAVDIIQTVGRPLRNFKGKKMAYILLPIVMEDESIVSREYRFLRQVLSAMALQDERITHILSGGWGTYKKKEDPIIKVIADRTTNVSAIINNIHLSVWDKIASFVRWSYEDAKKWFQSEYGDHFLFTDFQNLDTSLFPVSFPKDPAGYYKRRGQWVSWRDFLRNEEFLDYEETRQYLKKHFPQITSSTVFIKNKKSLPNFIHTRPDKFFTKSGEWVSWEKFLINYENKQGKKGHGRRVDRAKYLSYKEAKVILKELNFKRPYHFENWKKNRPKGMPSHPDVFYKKSGEWVSWDDFLGK